MTNESRSPEEIEREIEEQRSNLTSNLENLQDKFSIDTIVRQIGDQFREHGGDMSRSISDQVKANPIPLALTGIGLAWMMFGNQQKQTAAIPTDRNDGYSAVENDFRRTRLEQGRPYVEPTSYASAQRNGPSWAHDDEGDNTSASERMAAASGAVRDRASDSVSAVKDGASSAVDAVSNAASSAGSKISGTAASAKASLTNVAGSIQGGFTTAGSRISEGTETLSEEGRQRVIAARYKAIQLRRQTSKSAQKGVDAAADFYDNQPLVVGALALAFGAAMGGALPRTQTEDDLMGAQSDDVFSEAERIFEEEKSKIISVAKSVKDEVTDIAAETKADLDGGAPGEKTTAQAVSDKAKSLADRVVDTAKSTAKDENLGKPKA